MLTVLINSSDAFDENIFLYNEIGMTSEAIINKTTRDRLIFICFPPGSSAFAGQMKSPADVMMPEFIAYNYHRGKKLHNYLFIFYPIIHIKSSNKNIQ